MRPDCNERMGVYRTRRKRLLELLGLLRVLEDEGVELLRASDLELGLGGLGALLDPGGYNKSDRQNLIIFRRNDRSLVNHFGRGILRHNIHLASLRRQISRNWKTHKG